MSPMDQTSEKSPAILRSRMNSGGAYLTVYDEFKVFVTSLFNFLIVPKSAICISPCLVK